MLLFFIHLLFRVIDNFHSGKDNRIKQEYMDKKIQEYDEIIHFTCLYDRLRLYALLE